MCARRSSLHSDTVTAVVVAPDFDANKIIQAAYHNYGVSLGAGLGKAAGKVFRIGHLGDFNDLMLAGTLSGVEMGLRVADIPHQAGGVQAAMHYLSETAAAA